MKTSTPTRKRTRYAELAREIMQDIAQGKHPAGSSLPNEHELAEQYGVSRGTVRDALRIVQELGLVSRKKRAGTRVEPFRESEYSPTISSIEELAQYGEGAKRTVRFMREVVVDLELSRRLGMQAGSRWLHIGALRADPIRTDRSQCWSDIYVESAVGKKIRRFVRGSEELVYNLVQKSSGRVVAEVEQRIRAAGLTPQMAKELDAEDGCCALEITRRYLDHNGALLEAVVSIHPGDRFSYFTKLHRCK